MATKNNSILVPQTPIQNSEGKGVWQHSVQRVVQIQECATTNQTTDFEISTMSWNPT